MSHGLKIFDVLFAVSKLVFVFNSSRGVLLASKSVSKSLIQFNHFPVTTASSIHSSNGAGDTFCGSFISALLNDKDLSEAIHFGMEAAMLSLQCADSAISPRVSSLKIK